MAGKTTTLRALGDADSRRKWWQWVLMYPALAVALVGAVPQFGQWLSALRMGASPGSNVADLKAQQEAWNRNAKCLAEIKRVKPASQTAYAIDLLVCPSGDILLTLTPIQDASAQVSRWIMTRELLSLAVHTAQLPPDPAREPLRETAVHATRVVGVKQSRDLVVRRVQLSDNTCEDQTINPYTGRLVSAKRAPCDPF